MADSASVKDQTPDSASTGDTFFVGPMMSLRELGETIIRAQAAAWLAEYARSNAAALARERAATQAAAASEGQGVELAIAFYGRGLPTLPKLQGDVPPVPSTPS